MKNKKSILKFILTFFLIVNTGTYTLENPENFEDIYLQIRVKKKIDDFFMVKYDVEQDEIYIGMNSFLYFLELYDYEIKLKSMSVDFKTGGKEISSKFTNDEAYVLDDELYVNSKSLIKKLKFKYINYDPLVLVLDVVPDFILPYEEKEKGKVERIRLDNSRSKVEQIPDLTMSKKFIRPGMLKLDYNQGNLEEKEYNLNYEYGTQLLYGELYLAGSLKPEEDISTWQLTYPKFWKENELVLGTISPITPTFTSLSSNIIGLSINTQNTYLEKNEGLTIIKGEAVNADSVELYRNGILLDYLMPTTKNFEFRVADGMLSADYILKIYYNDGQVEERKVYSLNDTQALKKGSNRVVIQSGKNKNDGKFQNINQFYYGLTDRITVEVGVANLNISDAIKYDILEGNLIYSTGFQNFPTVINYKNFYEINSDGNSYNLSIDQKLLDYKLRYTQERYSEVIAQNFGTKEYDSISLGKTFKSNSIELGLSKRKNIENKDSEVKENSMFLSFYTTAFSPISFSTKIEKTKTENLESISYHPTISYSGFVNIILDGEIQKDDTKRRYEQNYALRIDKRHMRLFHDSIYGNIGFKGTYSNETKAFTYGITFDLDLESFINFTFKSDLNIDEAKRKEHINGISATKIINLNNPFQNVENDISVNSYIIHGKIFLDKNGNGIYDEGDEPIPEAIIKIDSNRTSSNNRGEYKITGTSNGDIVTLDVDRKSIDLMMKHTKGALKIETNSSSVLKVDIPVEVVSMVSGNIWNTEDFTEKEFIQIMSMTTVVLEKDGKEYKEIDPEFDGMYFFEDIPPGDYKIKFIYLGQENIEFSDKELDIKVALTNPEEGEYFEGYDTILRKVEVISQPTIDEVIEDNIDDLEYVGDIEDTVEDIEEILNSY